MQSKTASLDLVEFVEKNILPEYQNFDKAHSTGHVTRVIRRALDLALKVGADIDMAYVIAAYHDIGMSGPRAVHHITGGKILASDTRLKKWFSAEQIKIMREAIEDHRASAAHAPRSIYGRIVAEADRDLDPDIVFQRAVQFGLFNYPEMDKEKQWKRFVEHMENKYSVNGYIKLWIPQSDNAEKLKMLRDIISTPSRLRDVFNRLYDSEEKACR
ncbi:MAG: HD domain-containing protein [Prevotella sp.]|nr:HD domain-containing protein [Prevotella sp.]MDD5895697.1 HD domain-containing protein [Prevotellaceae bacterium]